jgi:hypothetical protein
MASVIFLVLFTEVMRPRMALLFPSIRMDWPRGRDKEGWREGSKASVVVKSLERRLWAPGAARERKGAWREGER